VLLIEEGRFQDDLAVPLKSAIISPEEMLRLIWANRNPLLVKAQEGLIELQRRDFFNAQVLRLLDHVGLTPERLIQMVLVLATVVVLLYVVYRLGIRERFRHPGELPLLAGVARSLPAAPLVDQRAFALVQMGNLNEPAARLARRWFERQGLAVQGDAPPLPPVEVSAGWWRRRQLQRQLQRLWRLARGQSAERLSPAALWRLQRELDRLQTRREQGEWRPKGDKVIR
jgi:hypothetical protein